MQFSEKKIMQTGKKSKSFTEAMISMLDNNPSPYVQHVQEEHCLNKLDDLSPSSPGLNPLENSSGAQQTSGLETSHHFEQHLARCCSFNQMYTKVNANGSFIYCIYIKKS